MNRFGINVELKHTPVLDPEFIPLMRFNQAFLEGAKKPVGIAVERAIAVSGQPLAGCPDGLRDLHRGLEAPGVYPEPLEVARHQLQNRPDIPLADVLRKAGLSGEDGPLDLRPLEAQIRIAYPTNLWYNSPCKVLRIFLFQFNGEKEKAL